MPCNIERANLTSVLKSERTCWLKENLTMSGQCGKQKATKLKVETVSKAQTEKKIDKEAEDAAEKAAKAEQRYDAGHNIFSK
jgi:hypothetical protein